MSKKIYGATVTTPINLDKFIPDSGEIPSYWKTALDEGVKSINVAMSKAGYNKAAFLFYSDSHWDCSSKMSPMLLKYLHSHTGMTKTIFGGDIVHTAAADYDTMAYLWDWRKQLEDLPNHHSVAGNHDGLGHSSFTEQYLYSYLFAAEETPDIVRGEQGTYYYIDSPAEKTRYLYLDTGYRIAALGSAQTAFVNDALISTPNGWHIVAIAHIWHENNYTESGGFESVGDLSTPAVILTSMFDDYNSRRGEYADCGGWVEFCIGGHTHTDHDSTTVTGIPIILVETDSYNINSGLGCAAGATTEASVNGIIADYDNHKITVVRIGRGASREITVTHHVVNYTNLLRSAISREDMTTVLMGDDGSVGYLNEQVFWSNSYYGECLGWDTTGLIPCSTGDVIRLKNITMPFGQTGDSLQGQLIYHNASGGYITSSGVNVTQTSVETGSLKGKFDSNGNLIEFTIPAWVGDCRYISMIANDINPASIITVNEVIE